MKSISIFLCTALTFLQSLNSQSLTPYWIEIKQGEVTSIDGNLYDGIIMPDLSWAWNSAVACFPATQAHKYTGNHILYALDLPFYTELDITVIPADKNANFSVYAYEVGVITENNTVPKLSQCIRCESDEKWDYNVRGKMQDHARHVHYILTKANPYQVIIGVCGADGLKEGAFTLQVKAMPG